ncbi:MAG: two-component system, NarL family, sensor kinase [Pseudonocardiales bacterium]|jgi:signal transduction histidine kinase|nr:two-component system, NarL family, sensor kinase [Pseudonocardiales bacterium]
MPGPVRTNPRVRRSLITYLGAAAFVLVVVAFGATLVGRQVAQDEALRDAERVAQRTANLVVAPLLGEILNGDASRRPELDRAVAIRLRDGSISELNVWDRTGTVIYSDDPKDIGERLPVPAEVAIAIDEGAVTSDVTTQPETGPLPGGDHQFLEVYAPLRLPGQAPLAFEIYVSYDRVENTANNLVLRIVPLAVGALLLLQLIQTPITVSLARRVVGHEAERTALLERALSASERERRQIAADLHDGVVQDLAGAGYALAALERRVADGPAAKHADQVGRVVRGAVESLRRLMVDIYPPDLSGAGLPGAIDDLADPLRRSGVTVHLRTEPLPGADSDVAATLYRVARETLANVAKHAEASTVEVDLSVDAAGTPPCVVLRVADDGVGIREGQLDRRAEGHLGLRLLIDRVADQGGELTVTRGPDGGTVALARVPATITGALPTVPSPRRPEPEPAPGHNGVASMRTAPAGGTAAGGGDAADRARADTTS